MTGERPDSSDMAEDNANNVRVISKKAKNVNYRSASHNVLIKHDDSYDALYHSAVVCHKKLRQLYDSVLDSLIADILHKLKQRYAEFTNSQDGKFASMCVLESGAMIFF